MYLSTDFNNSLTLSIQLLITFASNSLNWRSRSWRYFSISSWASSLACFKRRCLPVIQLHENTWKEKKNCIEMDSRLFEASKTNIETKNTNIHWHRSQVNISIYGMLHWSFLLQDPTYTYIIHAYLSYHFIFLLINRKLTQLYYRRWLKCVCVNVCKLKWNHKWMDGIVNKIEMNRGKEKQFSYNYVFSLRLLFRLHAFLLPTIVEFLGFDLPFLFGSNIFAVIKNTVFLVLVSSFEWNDFATWMILSAQM